MTTTGPLRDRDRLVRLETPSGVFWTPDDDLITRHLRDFGAHQRNELAMLLAEVGTGAVVVDIGAHIGTFTLPLARHVGPTGRVLAVEADPATYALLVRNVGSNGLSDRVTTKCAIMGRGGAAAVAREQLQRNTGAGHYRSVPGAHLAAVDARSILHEAGFARPDVVKIDVEGMETAVLRSLRPILSACRPKLYIDVVAAQLVRHGDTAQAIEALLRPLGYRFFRNRGERNSADDTFERVEIETLAEGGAFFDLLALP